MGEPVQDQCNSDERTKYEGQQFGWKQPVKEDATLVVVEKGFAILAYADVPVVCDHCGLRQSVQPSTEEVYDALVEATYLFEFKHELILLERLQTLFERFPTSLHPTKLAREYLHKEERPKSQYDPVFEEALNSDKELKEMLKISRFWLPGRLKFVREALERGQDWVNRSNVVCPSCRKGHYYIEQAFFEELI